jgi:hypothetical protein
MSMRRMYSNGQRFGKWTITEAYLPDQPNYARCQCDCGTVRVLSRSALQAGRTTQCRRCWIPQSREYFNGQRFGSWTIIEAYAPAPPEGQAVCQCDCGTVKRIQRGQLRHGLTKRCMRCKLAWSERLIGKKFRSLVITEVDVAGRMATLKCERCERCIVRDLQYARGRSDRNRVGRCPYCDVVGNPTALLRTGVTRQAVFARIERGWTREEATTYPKGQAPERIKALWSKRGPKPGSPV